MFLSNSIRHGVPFRTCLVLGTSGEGLVWVGLQRPWDLTAPHHSYLGSEWLSLPPPPNCTPGLTGQVLKAVGQLGRRSGAKCPDLMRGARDLALGPSFEASCLDPLQASLGCNCAFLLRLSSPLPRAQVGFSVPRGG